MLLVVEMAPTDQGRPHRWLWHCRPALILHDSGLEIRLVLQSRPHTPPHFAFARGHTFLAPCCPFSSCPIFCFVSSWCFFFGSRLVRCW